MTQLVQHVGWSFLRSRRWLGYFALLIIFSIACVWLGNWQFERRAQAQAEIARIDANYDAVAVPLAEAIADPTQFDEDTLKWQPVVLHGHYTGETFLARNRPGPGGVGSNLIHAFLTDAGTVFYIDRGWVAVSGTDEVPADLPKPPTGQTTVTARLRAAEPQIAGRTSAGRFVASVHPTELAALDDEQAQIYSASYGQLISEEPAGATGALAARPERDEGPHLSYALQWYVFIIIAAVGVGYAARQEYRGLNAEHESVVRDEQRREARKKRRGPTDADEEDALLDS
ncbi:MAG: SURF1 family protein [Leucobacter sp.]|nr:SURF1 family protein [Leucobacter sp.]